MTVFDRTFFESEPNVKDTTWQDNPFKWSGSFHFLKHLDLPPRVFNYSEDEILFELEIKSHNKVK